MKNMASKITEFKNTARRIPISEPAFFVSPGLLAKDKLPHSVGAGDSSYLLRQRFLKFIQKYWEINSHPINEIPAVYAICGFSFKSYGWVPDYGDIFYIGSTTRLASRYRVHKIPYLICKKGLWNVLIYLPMKKGFYDYEMKLINRLGPEFNVQHKKR